MWFFKKKKFVAGLEKTYQDEEVIIREGDNGSEMYIIKKGAVRVTKRTDKGEISLATLSTGDFFGEMAIFDHTHRSATVCAVGETQVIIIHAGNFLYRIRQDPTFVFEVMHKMSKRIRRLNEQLALIFDKEKLDPIQYETISAQTEFIR